MNAQSVLAEISKPQPAICNKTFIFLKKETYG
jgi:hypothetical protein